KCCLWFRRIRRRSDCRAKDGCEGRLEDGLAPTNLFQSIYFNHRKNFVMPNPKWTRERARPCAPDFHEASVDRNSARAPAYSLRKLLRLHARHELQSVLVVNLLQYFIWQIQTVKPPERVVAAVIFDVIVAGLQDAEIVSVLARLIDILTEEDAILVFDEEIAGEIGLASELGQYGCDVHVSVWVGVEQFAQSRQVVSMVAQVSQDERRLRMFRQHVVAFSHQCFELGVLFRRTGASRE